MKKLIMVLCALLCTSVHAGPIANIEYIHALIKQRHGIDIEYSPELKSEKLAANMKYLLSMVDIANTRINRAKFTHYGENDVYATLNAADTDTVITAVDELIKQIEFPFSFAPATESNEYMFTISAAGNFYIDWGDGIGQIIKKTKVGAQQITHTYENAANTYTIRLGGRATDYVLPGINVSVITFSNVTNINGCLGCVFSTIGDGTTAIKQPTFANLFYGNGKVTGQIPENLFNGIYGQPVKYMFRATFYACGFSGPIPEKLFAGIRGTPTQSVFERLFQSTGITEIPENLFAGISGAPASSMFEATFSGATGLTGEIPENLFSGIQGAPAASMFSGTFNGCQNLTGSIPETLFAGVSGSPVQNMFANTFYNCRNLTGQIPEKLFAGISGAPANSMFQSTFSSCSSLSGEIPGNLFAGIQGAPAASMFASTFAGCLGLTGQIPENLFAGIRGAPAANMFGSTFYDCKVLGDGGRFPENIFAGIDDTAPSAPTMFQATFNRCCRGLTGLSARINGKYLYDIWPDFTPSKGKTGGETYLGLTGLDDYADMPDFWKYSP